jgi:hypothetical protein
LFDEHVEAWVSREHSVEHPLWRCGLEQIGGYERRAGGFELRSALPRYGEDFGAFGYECLDRRQSDAPARPSHEDALARKIQVHDRSPSMSELTT